MDLKVFYCTTCSKRTWFQDTKPNFCQACGASYDCFGKSTPRTVTTSTVATAKVIEEKPATKIVWASEHRNKDKVKPIKDLDDGDEAESDELISQTPVSELKVSAADFIVEKEPENKLSLSDIMRSNAEKSDPVKPKRKYTKRAKKS